MFENRCEFYSCTSILNVSKYYFLFLFDSIFENNFVFVFIPYPSFVVMSHFSLRMLRIFGMIIFPASSFYLPLVFCNFFFPSSPLRRLSLSSSSMIKCTSQLPHAISCQYIVLVHAIISNPLNTHSLLPNQQKNSA